MSASTGKGRRARDGFTIIELMLVIAVLMVALLLLSQSLGAAMRLTNSNRETALAADGAQEMLEILQGVEDFSQLFALYNANVDDDPGLPGSAPGSNFAVRGLDPVPGDVDGFVGEILFPAEFGVADLELHEFILDQELSDDLGLPRDLNGDGALDGDDHSGDYQLLPVSVRLRWTGATGVREFKIQTLLADR
jgi:type II secretory pathway pseudopilin PulG